MAEKIAEKRDEWETDVRLERFVATALHDVRNPLNTASLHAQLLVMQYGKGMDEEPMRIASEIPRQLTKARKVLDGIEKIIGVLFTPSSWDVVPLEKALDSSIQSLEPEFRRWSGRLERETLPEVRGNGEQLKEVFKQILSNALRFGGAEPSVIQITCLSSESGCTVSIRDNGPGFEPKYAAEIFEPFKRLHDLERSGAGLGLALCREVLSRHGGRIWAESKPDEGSVFHMKFPPAREPIHLSRQESS